MINHRQGRAGLWLRIRVREWDGLGVNGFMGRWNVVGSLSEIWGLAGRHWDNDGAQVMVSLQVAVLFSGFFCDDSSSISRSPVVSLDFQRPTTSSTSNHPGLHHPGLPDDIEADWARPKFQHGAHLESSRCPA